MKRNCSKMYIGNDSFPSKFNELQFSRTEYHFVCHTTKQQHFNPLSPNSDQDQFSHNDIHTSSRDLVMRIYKMNTYCFALIFYQILSTHSLRKYIKISLENLYVDIMGLTGLITTITKIFTKNKEKYKNHPELRAPYQGPKLTF